MFGQYYDWSGATSADWNTASNWKNSTGNTSSVVPGTIDVAQIGVMPYTNGNNQPTPMTPSAVGTVIIGTNNTPKIILMSTLAIRRGLILNANSQLLVTGNNTLTLSENSSTSAGSSLTLSGQCTLLNQGIFTFKASTINIADATFNNTSTGTVIVGPSCIINLTSAAANITNTVRVLLPYSPLRTAPQQFQP